MYRREESKSLTLENEEEFGSTFQTFTPQTHSADSGSNLTFIPGCSHKISSRGLVVAGTGSGINMSIGLGSGINMSMGLGPRPRGAAVVQAPCQYSSSVSAWHLTKDGRCDVFNGHTGSVISLAVTPAPLPPSSAYPPSRYNRYPFLLPCDALLDVQHFFRLFSFVHCCLCITSDKFLSKF